jgi:hypothetical protein
MDTNTVGYDFLSVDFLMFKLKSRQSTLYYFSLHSNKRLRFELSGMTPFKAKLFQFMYPRYSSLHNDDTIPWRE